MNDPAWINAALISSRPQAIAALLRYFRDMDTAEEAYQEACLRALKNWTQNGPPRDPAAWLILVGRNAALDATRRNRKLEPLPPDEVLSDLDGVEDQLVERTQAHLAENHPDLLPKAENYDQVLRARLDGVHEFAK